VVFTSTSTEQIVQGIEIKEKHHSKNEEILALMEKIRANKAVCTRFRATQAFKELDEAIKAHEANQAQNSGR
jgi:succinyl-CoA synthetase alpha subunit